MTAIHGARSGSLRGGMLAILCAGFIALTLNWFDVATAFPAIAVEFKVGLGPLSLLISLFIIAYGVLHIPGGMLATRIGMKRTLVIGLTIQGLAGVMSGLSYSYGELAVFRIISGVGGSIFIAVAFAAVSVWFQNHRMTLALGVSGGAAFSVGAVVALYVWVYLQTATNWHVSLIVAGVFELVVALITLIGFRVPDGQSGLLGEKFDRASFRASLGNRNLWTYGLALLGGYGAYFTVSQLFSEYAITERHLSAAIGGLIAALIALAGIPAAILGGFLADRTRNLRAYVLVPLILCAVFLALIPILPTAIIWIPAIGIGFFLIFGFAAWTSVPARVAGIPHAYLGTATGLMLTLAAIGGFFVPIIFGAIAPAAGFDAGWFFLAGISLVFALVAIAGRNAKTPDIAVTPANPATEPTRVEA
jgi:ACS family D-galactonate transporter-like MFS transporter